MMSVATDAMDGNYSDFNSSPEATRILTMDSSEFDGEGDGEGDGFLFDEDNGFDISFDLGDIVAILGEDQHETAESYQLGESPPSQNPSQKIQAVSNPDMDRLREIGGAQWNQHDFAVMEHLFDNSSNMPSHITSTDLMPSFSTTTNDPMNMFGSYLVNNFNQQPQLQNNLQEFSISSGEGMEKTYINLNLSDHDSVCQNTANTEYETAKTNGTLSTENDEPSSALIFPPEITDINKTLPCITNQISTSGLAVDDGYPISLHLYTNPDEIEPEINTFDSNLGTCRGSNSSLTLHMDFSSNAELALLQTASGQLEACFPDNLLKMNDYMPPLNKVKLRTEEESPDSPLPEVSISDLDSPLSDELCSEYNQNDDINLTSEPSTDSSPFLSAGNTNFDYVDCSYVDTSEQALSGLSTIWPSKHKPINKDDGQDQLHQLWYDHLKGGKNTVQTDITRSRISIKEEEAAAADDDDDDDDVCILEDISAPACPPQALYKPSLYSMPQHIENIGARLDDERLTYRLALQDLSQTKSEASPPDGLLSVSLLKHQRIALAWMVQKETASLHCCGGILADDQGLGKTISTIALILMERSPLPRTSTLVNKGVRETLNLDDDGVENDDGKGKAIELNRLNGPTMMISRSLVMDGMNMRPVAGTLVVCPTSVLRQWADELQTKVTREANLSFLLYHGCNRTKDPNELAKYDVVLTTYSIVSMEVPKQGLVDKDDEEREKHDLYEMSDGFLNSKKRKFSSKSSSKKDQNKISARPLGRVGWFRVILDEAQSIKNHRTQVARACWGLRAKRRWCLSGTPIQNAIDDLYSYFRFLRYDPYADYQSFCSTIKNPINRSRAKGYKKLQAVLQTIMLRRTKATILDGKPIINLPPKTVSLRKVEFSTGEREFYSTLEAASREQFAEYEDAGTVKQNYVNILLMLLRLRQACDHPLMVKANESNPCQKACLDMVRKLPREKRIVLLSYLEVSLAICTICNDPPEDVVVTICGHVFCNQCISEHLTTDDSICPSSNCKIRLSSASIFSRSTLKSSLSDELSTGCGSASSDFKEEDAKYGSVWSPYSSKIKTTLEILQSLPRHSQCEISNKAVSSTIKGVKVEGSNREASEKAIIFSQWTKMLDLLEGPLKASGIEYRRLDGTMSVNARDKAIRDFKTLPEVTVIIMSLKAASLGLNLVVANHVILLDLWWNPTTEDQAIDRAHRIGQTRPVTVSRLTVSGTVEDKILKLQEKKREMVACAFGEDENGSRQSRLTLEDLRYLFSSNPSF